MNEEQLIAKLLKVLEENILPLTKIEVKRGNKIFGAAILKKSDLNLVVAGTNQETHNPLWHGEISCLNSYWALPKNKRVSTKDCIFFSTHEPCSLCLSAITWSGFDNFYYFFSYQDSRDKFPTILKFEHSLQEKKLKPNKNFYNHNFTLKECFGSVLFADNFGIKFYNSHSIRLFFSPNLLFCQRQIYLSFESNYNYPNNRYFYDKPL